MTGGNRRTIRQHGVHRRQAGRRHHREMDPQRGRAPRHRQQPLPARGETGAVDQNVDAVGPNQVRQGRVVQPIDPAEQRRRRRVAVEKRVVRVGAQRVDHRQDTRPVMLDQRQAGEVVRQVILAQIADAQGPLRVPVDGGRRQGRQGIGVARRPAPRRRADVRGRVIGQVPAEQRRCVFRRPFQRIDRQRRRLFVPQGRRRRMPRPLQRAGRRDAHGGVAGIERPAPAQSRHPAPGFPGVEPRAAQAVEARRAGRVEGHGGGEGPRGVGVLRARVPRHAAEQPQIAPTLRQVAAQDPPLGEQRQGGGVIAVALPGQPAFGQQPGQIVPQIHRLEPGIQGRAVGGDGLSAAPQPMAGQPKPRVRQPVGGRRRNQDGEQPPRLPGVPRSSARPAARRSPSSSPGSARPSRTAARAARAASSPRSRESSSLARLAAQSGRAGASATARRKHASALPARPACPSSTPSRCQASAWSGAASRMRRYRVSAASARPAS